MPRPSSLSFLAFLARSSRRWAARWTCFRVPFKAYPFACLQVSEKIRYCKWKAVDITKALKEGRQPTAGPPGGPEGAPGEFDAIAGSSNVPRMSIGGGTSASSPPAYGSPDVTRPNASSPSAPPPAAITPPLVPPPISQTPQHIHARVESAPATSSSSSSFAAQVPGSFLDPKISTEIQKHCRYTISALQYDDLKTAAQNLEKALELLRPHLNK